LSFFLEEGDVHQMIDPAPPSWLLEVYFIGFWLLAEKCKPIIICGAYKPFV